MGEMQEASPLAIQATMAMLSVLEGLSDADACDAATNTLVRVLMVRARTEREAIAMAESVIDDMAGCIEAPWPNIELERAQR